VISKGDKLNVLFVCLGNICRSPLAEGVFRHLVQNAGLGDSFHIESAGTSSYHIGDAPDQRTSAVALSRGVRLSGAARQMTTDDLERFDHIVVMDEENLEAVQRLARGRATRAQVQLLREFDEEAAGDLAVPDPYYGGARGFENVHDIVERSCRSLLDHLRTEHGI
jgi:protein-tyrosine phosphatase